MPQEQQMTEIRRNPVNEANAIHARIAADRERPDSDAPEILTRYLDLASRLHQLCVNTATNTMFGGFQTGATLSVDDLLAVLNPLHENQDALPSQI